MTGESASAPTWLDLFDWRARVVDLYRVRDTAHRRADDPAATLARFRATKDALLAHHPQTPFGPDALAGFTGLRYFPYAPELRVEAELVAADGAADEALPFGDALLRPAGHVRFSAGGIASELVVYWIDVYGGGLILPFRDATCPVESYGGGRYLFDTVKGSTFERLDDLDDLDDSNHGYAGGRIALDFNYAYNPSCAYDERWTCPLAPRQNTLAAPIRAGERKYWP